MAMPVPVPMPVVIVVVVVVIVVVPVVVPVPVMPVMPVFATGAMVVPFLQFDAGFDAQPRREIEPEVAVDMPLEPIDFIAALFGVVDLVQVGPGVEMADQKGKVVAVFGR